MRPAKETESSRQLLRRLESGRRRVAEMRKHEGLPPLEDWPPDDLGGSTTITEILHCGRTRSALCSDAPV
jgi:hypothetical protein